MPEIEAIAYVRYDGNRFMVDIHHVQDRKGRSLGQFEVEVEEATLPVRLIFALKSEYEDKQTGDNE
jgi:hypothetical protein